MDPASYFTACCLLAWLLLVLATCAFGALVCLIFYACIKEPERRRSYGTASLVLATVGIASTFCQPLIDFTSLKEFLRPDSKATVLKTAETLGRDLGKAQCIAHTNPGLANRLDLEGELSLTQTRDLTRQYLEHQLVLHPRSPALLARLAVLLNDAGESSEALFSRYLRGPESNSKSADDFLKDAPRKFTAERTKVNQEFMDVSEREQALLRELGKVYSGKITDAQLTAGVINVELPDGWYRDTALASLGHIASLPSDLTVNGHAASCEAFCSRLQLWDISRWILGAAGLSLIFAFLFLNRPSQGLEKPPWSGRRVWACLVCFYYAALISGTAAAFFQYSLGAKNFFPGPVLEAVDRIAMLLAAWFSLYFVLYRSAGLSFFRGIFSPSAGQSLMKILLQGAGGFCMAVGMALVTGVIHRMFTGAPVIISNPAHADIIDAMRSDDALSIVACFFSVSVLAPLIEEPIFRGALFWSLRARFSFVPAALLSSLIFAIGHLDLTAFPYYVGAGFILAMVCERSRSLAPAVVAHGLFNAWATMADYLYCAPL